MKPTEKTNQPNSKTDELRRKRPPFTLIENEVIKDLELSGYAVLVYAALCMYADHEGKCWPGLKKIARFARCARSTAQKAVKELIGKGYLVKEKRQKEGGKEPDSNLYTITGKTKPNTQGVPPSGIGIPSGGIGCIAERYTGIPSGGKELYPVEPDPTNQREEDAASQPLAEDRSIYYFFKQAFVDANPELFKHNRSAFGKEGPAIKKLEEIALDQPDPLAWAQLFLDTAQRMRESGDKWYGSWPFLASTLCGNSALPRILNAMKRHEVDPETEKIAEGMNI